MVVEKYSWAILDDVTAIKHTDLSFFKNHGSGIPIEFRYFFEIEAMEPGDNRSITISLEGNEDRGRLNRSRSTTKVTRIFWGEDLSSEFNRLFPTAIKKKEYPDIRITKCSSERFEMDFVDHYASGEFQVDDDNANDLENKVYVPSEEGRKVVYYTTRYERDRKNREEAIEIHGTKCMACGFDFEKVYGERGRHFIEVHHIVPLCSKDEAMKVDPEKDLICVCSNCHRMIHRSRSEVLTLEKLKEIIRECAELN